MRIVVRRAQEQKWREDHAECIAAYNAKVCVFLRKVDTPELANERDNRCAILWL